MVTESTGFRGQAPHDIFQKYMEEIVRDPAFEGMPDSHYDDGRIQWEAPSNRTGGKFKDSHHRRREWWAKQAEKLGISTLEDRWISRVAKTIHPSKKKPCKKCGQVMDIRYVYPSGRLLDRIRSLPFVSEDFETSTVEDVFALVRRLHEHAGDRIFVALPALLKPKAASPSRDAGLDAWLAWLENEYVPEEPRVLSPGAMSNAPDRLDGFHSFNRCCRATADTGRTATNLRTYTTDRRVFEYWTSGDWIAADRLMGILRRDFRDEPCLNGHLGPCQADHIGPISLGFNHRPHFQLLCRACNSAKNNRMYPSDVQWLIAREARGEDVISWHSKKVWDECKGRISTREHALRLSKLLRDNRHSYMNALSEIAKARHFGFLASLLELEHADFDVEFVGLRIENHVTEWDDIRHTRRQTRYAVEQKARRSRIAFAELMTYFEKENRNAFVVSTADSEGLLRETLAALEERRDRSALLDRTVMQAIMADPEKTDERFRQVYIDFAEFNFTIFARAREILHAHMDAVGRELASMWEHERFTRELALAEPDDRTSSLA